MAKWTLPNKRSYGPVSPKEPPPAKGSRRSISNYVYNHIGSFAAANDAFCKALFLGGVTRRFPELNFGFLEGGVAWAIRRFVFEETS